MAPDALPRFWPTPTQAEVEAISRMDDPVLRNLHITHKDHLLKVSFTDVMGEMDHSWCGFSTWASNPAMDAVARHIAQGNLLVFQELGPLYTAMLSGWNGRRTIRRAARRATGGRCRTG